jgi:hypothetical protein
MSETKRNPREKVLAESRRVKVHLRSGRWEETWADVYGSLAIHRGVDGDKGWTVTHIPTGYVVVGRYRSKADARAAMEKLRRFSWERFSTVKGLLRWKDYAASKRVVNRLRKASEARS